MKLLITLVMVMFVGGLNLPTQDVIIPEVFAASCKPNERHISPRQLIYQVPPETALYGTSAKASLAGLLSGAPQQASAGDVVKALIHFRSYCLAAYTKATELQVCLSCLTERQ